MKNLSKKPTIKLLLDDRRVLKNNCYPIKFQIIYNRKSKLYSTGINMPKKQFEKIISGSYLTPYEKKLAADIASLNNHYNVAAEKTTPFEFKAFERRLNSKYYGITENVFQMFEVVIASLVEEGRIKTASSYRTTLHKIKKFAEVDSLAYVKINVDFLKSFERFVTKPNDKGKSNSIATAGIYMRTLRAIYNKAIGEKLISNELYPFGRGKYEIRSKVRTKKAVSLESIKKLLAYKPINPIEEKALDFWKFSFWSHGMNPKDIAKLKWEDVDETGFSFYRSKTEFTSKTLVPIKVTLSPQIKNILKRQGMGRKLPSDYIFPIYADGMDEINKNNRVVTYNKRVNKRVNAIGVKIGIKENLNMYTARHSFVTLLIYNNVPISAIKDMVGHSNTQTTESYINSIEVNYQKGVIKKLGDLVR